LNGRRHNNVHQGRGEGMSIEADPAEVSGPSGDPAALLLLLFVLLIIIGRVGRREGPEPYRMSREMTTPGWRCAAPGTKRGGIAVGGWFG
jgi:hypothetical protein